MVVAYVARHTEVVCGDVMGCQRGDVMGCQRCTNQSSTSSCSDSQYVLGKGGGRSGAGVVATVTKTNEKLVLRDDKGGSWQPGTGAEESGGKTI